VKAFKIATLISTLAVVFLVVNHVLIKALVAGIANGAGAPVNLGVAMPARLVVLVKLDHLALDFGYILIPLLWFAAFLVCVSVRAWLKVPKTTETPKDAPVDP
jgi:hypothetical protein